MSRALATVVAMAASTSITLGLVALTIGLTLDASATTMMAGLVLSVLAGMAVRFSLRDWVARHAAGRPQEPLPTARVVK